MNITVIGTGYVGLVTGACLASKHNVICVDKDKNKIDGLRAEVMPIYEAGLQRLVANNVDMRRLRFTIDLAEAIHKSDIIFICVGTPIGRAGCADTKALWSVIESIERVASKQKIVVIKSTVPVGTNALVQQQLNLSNLKHQVVSNPEFLREGVAVADFQNPDRVVLGGNDADALQTIRKVYTNVYDNKIVMMAPENAELVKYVSNCFLATKISFINEMANICEGLGGDIREVRGGVGMDKRIGFQFLNAGLGYGGSCFPKDVTAMCYMAETNGIPLNILPSVIKVNSLRPQYAYNKLRAALGRIKGTRVCIWGGAFKPDTDDIRESPGLELVRILLDAEAQVKLYDPQAEANIRKEFGNSIRYADTPEKAAKDADAIVLVTEWQEFLEIDKMALLKTMRGSIFFDGRGMFLPNIMADIGYTYLGVGKQNATPRDILT